MSWNLVQTGYASLYDLELPNNYQVHGYGNPEGPQNPVWLLVGFPMCHLRRTNRQ